MDCGLVRIYGAIVYILSAISVELKYNRRVLISLRAVLNNGRMVLQTYAI